LSTGPPDEPDEIGAVIWRYETPSSTRRALTRPSLNVRSSPIGLPITYTRSPTASAFASPASRVVSRVVVSFSTAMSRRSSVPSTNTSVNVSPVASSTSSDCAPSTTWKFVTITPSDRITNPLPLATSAPSTSARMLTTAGPVLAAISRAVGSRMVGSCATGSCAAMGPAPARRRSAVRMGMEALVVVVIGIT
jgi:hypothetical protein